VDVEELKEALDYVVLSGPATVNRLHIGGVLQPVVKQVGSRTFYFVEDRWIDAEYDSKGETRKIELFSDAYFDLIAKHPEVAKILALGERVVFRIGETWYETQPPAEAQEPPPE